MRCIYKITINERYYIGSTINLKNRIRLHILDLNKNNHKNSILQRAYNKHGYDNFKYEILKIVGEEENLFEVEQRYLDEYYDDDMCMNLAKIVGGGNLYKRTPEILAKSLATRNSNKGTQRYQEFRNKCVSNMKKVKSEQPEIFKEAAAKGRKNRWERDCKPFVLIKNDTEYGSYRTQEEAFSTGILSNVSISRLIQGKLDKVKGYSLKFI